MHYIAAIAAFALFLAAISPLPPSANDARAAGEVVYGNVQDSPAPVLAASSPQDERNAIDAIIARYGPDLSLSQRARLDSFAKCESGYVELNPDGSPFLSGYGTPDCGAFQINSIHWDAPDAAHASVCTSLEANVQVAVGLYRAAGAQPWENSAKCWNKPVPGW